MAENYSTNLPVPVADIPLGEKVYDADAEAPMAGSPRAVPVRAEDIPADAKVFDADAMKPAGMVATPVPVDSIPSDAKVFDADAFRGADMLKTMKQAGELVTAASLVPVAPLAAPVVPAMAAPVKAVSALAKGMPAAPPTDDGLSARAESIRAEMGADLIDIEAEKANIAYETVGKPMTAAHGLSPAAGIEFSSQARSRAPFYEERKKAIKRAEAAEKEIKKQVLKPALKELWDRVESENEEYKRQNADRLKELTRKSSRGEVVYEGGITSSDIGPAIKTLTKAESDELEELQKGSFAINLRGLTEEARMYLETGVRADIPRSWNKIVKGGEWTEKIPFSPAGFFKMVEINDIYEKKLSGTQLTDYEQARLNEFASDKQLMSELGQTVGSGIFDTVVDMVPFAIEYAVTSGLASYARAGAIQASKGLLSLSSKLGRARQFAAPAAKTLIGGRGAALARTVASAPDVAAGVIDRRLNQLEFRDAEAFINKDIERRGVGSALWGSFIEVFAEQAGESAGATIKGLPAATKSRLAKVGLIKAAKEVAPDVPTSKIVKAFERFGIGDIGEEWLEERYSALLREVLGADKVDRDPGIVERFKRIFYADMDQMWTEIGSLAIGSGMPTGAKIVRRMNTQRKIASELIQNNVEPAKAKEYGRQIAEAETPEQLVATLEKIGVETGMQSDPVKKARLGELSAKTVLTDEERAEWNTLSSETQELDTIEEREARLEKDIETLSKTDIGIVSGENITAETKPTDTDLQSTAKAINTLYGIANTKETIRAMAERIIDLYVDPVQKIRIETEQEQKARQASEIDVQYNQWKNGTKTTEEFANEINGISEELYDEIVSRLTGAEQEAPSVVMRDIVKRIKDGQYAVQEREATPIPAREEAPAGEGVGQEVRREGQPEVVEEEAVAREPVAEKESLEKETEDAVEAEREVSNKEILELVADGQEVAQGGRIYTKRNGKWFDKKTGTEITNVIFLSGLANQLRKGGLQVEQDVALVEAGMEPQKAGKVKKTKPVRASVDPAKLVSEILRLQESASVSGLKEGIRRIKEQTKQTRDNAKELKRSALDAISQIKGIDKETRLKLTVLAGEISSKATEKGQASQFEKVMDKIGDAMEEAEKRLPRYEYKPYPEPQNEFGVDANSKWADIRKAYLENGGKRNDGILGRSATKKEMERFLLGTAAEESTALLNGAIEGLEKQRDKKKQSRLVRKFTQLSNATSWLKNLDDMLRLISFEDNSGYVRNRSNELSEGRSEQGRVENELNVLVDENGLRDLINSVSFNPLGKVRHYTLSLDGRTIRISGSEAAFLYLSLRAADNRAALAKLKSIVLSGNKEISFKSVEELERELEGAIDQNGTKPDMDAIAEKWPELSSRTGELVKERYDDLQKKRGSDKVLDLIEGIYLHLSYKTPGIDSDPTVSVENVGMDVSLNNSAFNMIGRSELKERIGSVESGSVRIPGLITVMNKMIDNTSEFYGAGEAIFNIARMLSNKSLSKEIISLYGQAFYDNMVDEVRHVQGGVRRGDTARTTKFIERIPRFLVRKATQWRLIAVSTQLKMYGSVFLAMPSLNHDKAALAFALAHPGNKFLRDEALKDGTIGSRYNTEMYSPEMSYARNEKAILKNMRGSKTLRDKARVIIKSWGDKSAIMTMFRMVAFDEMVSQGRGTTLADLKKLDQEFFDGVRKKVAYLIGTTQPSGYPEHLSVLKNTGRHHIGAMMLSLYGSQRSRLYGNMDSAWGEYIFKRDAESLKKLGKTLRYFSVYNSIYMALVSTATGLVGAGMKALWSGLTGSGDDDEALTDAMLEEVKGIPASIGVNMFNANEVTGFIAEEAMKFRGSRYRKEQPLDDFAGRELASIAEAVINANEAYKMIEAYNDGLMYKRVDGKKQLVRIRTKSQQQAVLSSIETKVSRAVESANIATGFWLNIPTRYLEVIEPGDLAGKSARKILE